MKPITDEMRAAWLMRPDSCVYFDANQCEWVAYLRNDTAFTGDTKTEAIDQAVCRALYNTQ